MIVKITLKSKDIKNLGNFCMCHSGISMYFLYGTKLGGRVVGIEGKASRDAKCAVIMY